MKIFCIGVTGYVGLAVIKCLVAAGHDIVVLYRSEKSFSPEFKQILTDYKKITLVKGDVLEPQSIQIPKDCDACIYMACNSRWGTLETQSTIDIAVKGT